ncbi:MAG: hypothetical protein RR475_02390 [Clostridia bacterium]
MSADNGIYILKCKDQYRVVHAQAIENLHWSFVTGESIPELVPTRVYELYSESRYTRNKQMALFIASKMLEDLPVCEYGIKIIRYKGTWAQLCAAAKELAPAEIEAIRRPENYRWEGYLEKLYEMANMILEIPKELNKAILAQEETTNKDGISDEEE